MKNIILSIFVVSLIFPLAAFAFDDTSGHLNEKAIDYLQENDIVQGYDDDTYRPDNQINRAEFLKIILESLDVDLSSDGFCFPDVKGDWYAPYVCEAKYLGIVSGYQDGYFRPDNKVNFAEALKIILEAYDASVDYSYSVWYEPYFYFMKEKGLLSLVNTDISHAITRGELAQLIYNIDDYDGSINDNPPSDHKPDPKPQPLPEPEQLTQYPMSAVSLSASEWDIHLNVGDIYELSDENFLRLDEIDSGTAHLTMWNTGDKGCRLADGGIYLKDQDNHERYEFYLNWLFELQELNDDSVDLRFYTGDLAYQKCIDGSLQNHRCLTFHPGSYKIQSENFARYFDSQSYYDYNNLMLNYAEAAYAKLKSVFPSLALGHPFGDRWNFIAPIISEATADSAWLDTAVTQVVTDGGTANQLLTDSDLLDTYVQKINDNDLDFTFSTEMHEWTHLVDYPTEFGRNPNHDGTVSELDEGFADYVESIAKNYPDGVDIKYAFCGEDRFVGGDVNTLDGMTYVEAFDQGYNYDTGKCFFKQVEESCGLPAIDSMFEELLSYQYEPFSYHSNSFKVLRDNCSNQSDFDQIMSNFGFSLDLLDETYQLGDYIPIKEMACSTTP